MRQNNTFLEPCTVKRNLAAVDASPDIAGWASRYIRTDLYLDISGCFWPFFNRYCHYIKHNKLYLGNFWTIRIYPEFFPYRSGWLSAGLKSAYIRMDRCNPDIAGNHLTFFYLFVYWLEIKSHFLDRASL